MKCRFWRFVAKNESVADEHKLSRIRCKQWDCDYCSKRLQAQWRAHLNREIARIGGAWSMLTITADGKDHHDGQAIVSLRTHLDPLQKRLKRAWGRFEYVRFFETHQSGEYHAHVLAQVYPPDPDDIGERINKRGEVEEYYKGVYLTELKRHSAAVGLGYIADVKPLGDVLDVGFALIVTYVTKYLTKQAQQFTAPKGMRRVQCSSGFAPLKAATDEESGWTVDNGGYTKDEFQVRADAGIRVTDLDKRRLVTLDDYKHVGIYPHKTTDDKK